MKENIKEISVSRTYKALILAWEAIDPHKMTSREAMSIWRENAKNAHVRKLPASIVLPYLMQETYPTIEDAIAMKLKAKDRYDKVKHTDEPYLIPEEEAFEADEQRLTGFTFDGQTMTSMYIAQETGKQHSHVMRDIRDLLGQGVSESNFGRTSYTDSQGKVRPCYNLTKKGCLILITGYRADMREKIIDRWEALETGKATPLVKMDQLDILSSAIQVLKEDRDRINALEDKMQAYDSYFEEQKKALANIPLAQDKAVSKTERNYITELVCRFAIVALNHDYEGAWDKLYREFRYRYHIDLKARSKNCGCSAIECADRDGHIHDLYVLASELYGNVDK